MKTIDEKTTKALQALIIINNDRYEGYMTAAEHAKDIELKTLFNKYSMQSKQFAAELRALLPDQEAAPDKDTTTISGKIYRRWMDVKDNLAGGDRKAVLSSCEFGEDAAKKTYKEVLDETEDISPEALAVVRKQDIEIRQAHDTIKSMRDSA
jgi:uncharacterized protein (TIGR02284 family)